MLHQEIYIIDGMALVWWEPDNVTQGQFHDLVTRKIVDIDSIGEVSGDWEPIYE